MNSKNIVLPVFSAVFKIVLMIIIVMVVYRVSILAYDYGQRVFNEPPVTSGSGRAVTIVISQEDTVKEVGWMLENRGLIRDSLLFRIQEMVSEYHDKIIPGTYELNTSMTISEMLGIMSGQTEKEE